MTESPDGAPVEIAHPHTISELGGMVFHAPCDLLSLNGRYHHMEKYELEQEWQKAAIYAGQQFRRNFADLDGIHVPAALVECRFWFATKRDRDPHNYFATVKPIVDGLVKARLWPKDTPQYVRTIEPECRVDKRKADLGIVEIMLYRNPWLS